MYDYIFNDYIVWNPKYVPRKIKEIEVYISEYIMAPVS